MRGCDAAIAFTLIQVFSGNAREEIQMLELGKGIGHQVDSLLTRSVAALLPQLTRRFCEAAVREGGGGIGFERRALLGSVFSDIPGFILRFLAIRD